MDQAEEQVDPVLQKCIDTVAKRAEELGVELPGRIWVKTTGRAKKTYEVHSGKLKLGTLSHDKYVKGELDDLFLNRRVLWLWVTSPADPGDVKDGQPVAAPAWTDWSRPIFGLRWALGALMDNAFDELRLSAIMSTKNVPDLTRIYQSITGSYQDKLREEAAKKYAKTKSEQDRAAQEFSLSGSTASAAGQVVMSAFKRWKNGEIGPPSWRGPGSVIPVRADAIELQLKKCTRDDGEEVSRVLCAMRIFADKHPETGLKQHKTCCYVRTNGDSDGSTLRRILKGDFKATDAKLIWDATKKKWKIGLCYSTRKDLESPMTQSDSHDRRDVFGWASAPSACAIVGRLTRLAGRACRRA
jgi:hypothetical protein